jgi:hypothetical protein
MIESLFTIHWELQAMYSPGFPLLLKCFYIHDILMLEKLPTLAAHLVRFSRQKWDSGKLKPD